MKIIMIILCIILTPSPLLWAGGQQPPETRPPEVPKKRLIETQQPPETRPPEVPKEQPPELVPKCKDNEIFKDGKCVKK